MSDHLIRTYRYALRVNDAEGRRLAGMLEVQRQVYNAALAERIGAYRWIRGQATLIGLDRPDRAAAAALDPDVLDDRRRAARGAVMAWRAPDALSQKAVLTLVAQRAALGEVVVDAPSVATRWTLDRLEAAFDGFFRRVAAGGAPGFPRFRARARWRSFGCSELRDGDFSRPTGFVRGTRAIGLLKVPNLPKALAVRVHRQLPDGAVVRSCVLTLDRTSGRWEVALSCRMPVTHGCETDDQLAGIAEGEVLGYDAGVAFQATDSDGRRYLNVRRGERKAAEVRRVQRRLARAKRGSGNRDRAKARLARLRRAEADARSTASRQNAAALIGAALARGCRAVAREDLDLGNMRRSAAGTAAEPGAGVARKRGLNRALADAALALFAKDVEGKAESAGLRVIAVDPRRTSLTCSGCRVADHRSLEPRTYRCVACGMTMDRDRNAAVNIARLAVELHAPRPPDRSAARRGRRSCASEPRTAVPAVGRDGPKPRRRGVPVSDRDTTRYVLEDVASVPYGMVADRRGGRP